MGCWPAHLLWNLEPYREPAFLLLFPQGHPESYNQSFVLVMWENLRPPGSPHTKTPGVLLALRLCSCWGNKGFYSAKAAIDHM